MAETDQTARREFQSTATPAGDGRLSVAIGRLWHAGGGMPGDGGPLVDLDTAFDVVTADLDRLATQLRAQGLAEPAAVIETNALIARDPDLRSVIERNLAAGASPVPAVSGATEHFARVLESLSDPVLAGRATDVRAVGRRLVAALQGGPGPAPSGDRRIVVGWEVTADDLLTDAGSVVGALSVLGGATAHVGIVCRSLGIPVAFGIDPALLDLPDGTEVMVDTRSGRIVVAPGEADHRFVEQEARAFLSRRTRLAAARGGRLSTRDGDAVVVLANVASEADARLAVSMDAPGIGLLRTEMPFLSATAWPSYAEHLARLTPVLRPLAGLPVTVRTLDFADDKLPPFLRAGRIGPLGSGLSLMLAQPGAFGAQLRAILQCGLDCAVRVSVMFPMVDSAATLRRCRDLVAAAAAEVGVPAPQVGAMVEMREVIPVIEELAEEADFLSIGTNDLTAAILGLGRRDPALTPARVREPAVLDAVARTVRAGRARGRSVSVCGDAASDPSLVPVLLDSGCRVLSVAPAMLDEVRAAAREHG